MTGAKGWPTEQAQELEIYNQVHLKIDKNNEKIETLMSGIKKRVAFHNGRSFIDSFFLMLENKAILKH